MAFNLLSKCDDTLYDLERSFAEDADEDESAAKPVAESAGKPTTSQKSYTADYFARSGKCLCGAKVTEDEGKKGKKVVHDDWDKAGKLKGQKVPLT